MVAKGSFSMIKGQSAHSVKLQPSALLQILQKLSDGFKQMDPSCIPVGVCFSIMVQPTSRTCSTLRWSWDVLRSAKYTSCTPRSIHGMVRELRATSTSTSIAPKSSSICRASLLTARPHTAAAQVLDTYWESRRHHYNLDSPQLHLTCIGHRQKLPLLRLYIVSNVCYS